MFWLALILVIICGLALRADRNRAKPLPNLPPLPARPRPEAPEYRLTEVETNSGSGYVVIRERVNQRLQWQSLPKSEGIWAFNVAGTSHRPRKMLNDRGFNPGRRLRLIPEPENEYDPRAVAVWNGAGTVMAGYVPKDLTGKVHQLLESGLPFTAMSMWVSLGNSERGRGVRVLIAENGAPIALST